jgi:hypothetical protein
MAWSATRRPWLDADKVWSSHIVNAASVAPSFGVASRALDFANKFTMLGFSQSHLIMNCGWEECIYEGDYHRKQIVVMINFFSHESLGAKDAKTTPT